MEHTICWNNSVQNNAFNGAIRQRLYEKWGFEGKFGGGAIFAVNICHQLYGDGNRPPSYMPQFYSDNQLDLVMEILQEYL